MHINGQKMKKQVNKSHYDFDIYVTKERWASLWHQINEAITSKRSNILEVGPGPGLFKLVGNQFGLKVETLDLDPDLKPDHLASVFEMPFENKAFDIVCAFQMLEHLPYEKSLMAFKEMVRVSSGKIIISLPDCDVRWPVSFYIPKFGMVRFSIPKPKMRSSEHVYDGQHYWEVGKKGFALEKIIADFCQTGKLKLTKNYRVHENLYHRFMVFEIIN